MNKKQKITDIFIRGRKLTLGVKLVGAFAITYYLLYFCFLPSLESFTETSTIQSIQERLCFKG